MKERVGTNSDVVQAGDDEDEKKEGTYMRQEDCRVTAPVVERRCAHSGSAILAVIVGAGRLYSLDYGERPNVVPESRQK
jgi:hypothetical protein